MPASFRSASPDADAVAAVAAAAAAAAVAAAGDIEYTALALDDDPDGDADCIGALACAGRRSSFTYRRLPEPLLRLTVRKLDASCFEVQIARTAAVSELKAAIEDVFFAAYDDPDRTISWQHVWSHFCLCFKDEKLTDDKATLRAFGIKDGDELHFAQHLSVDDGPCINLSKTNKTHRRSKTSLDDCSSRPRTILDDFNQNEGEKLADMRRCSTSVYDEDFCVNEGSEQCVEEGCKKGSFFRGWFSYSRFRGNRKTHAEYTVPSSCERKNTRLKLGKWLSSKGSKAQCN